MYNCRMFPHKPKPLCSCWVGDKMVDMYSKHDFDRQKVGWGKAYVGHLHTGIFDELPLTEINEEEQQKIDETVRAIDEYFLHHQLYLH